MKTRGQQAKLRRRELDRLFAKVRDLQLAAPRDGWISSIRESLGISGQELARRLKVDPSVVSRLERSEAKRTITLSSLDRAAAALGCRVVYTLLPERLLEETISTRAKAAAKRLRKPVSHSMSLEDQSLDQLAAQDREQLLIEELVDNLDPALWSEEQ